jgi:hypothetical protein
MRTYIVKPGDSPASIAARDDMAGCPKCCADLVKANWQKEAITYPNGYVTFKSLVPGETLNLPEKWFDPAFDLLPPAYFASLPYADGVTPSPFGKMAYVILRDFRALDNAADLVRGLEAMDDHRFAMHAGDVAVSIDAAVEPAIGRSPYAQAVQEGVRLAASHSRMFSTLLAAGLPRTNARAQVQATLAAVLLNAQRAVGELYGSVQPPGALSCIKLL